MFLCAVFAFRTCGATGEDVGQDMIRRCDHVLPLTFQDFLEDFGKVDHPTWAHRWGDNWRQWETMTYDRGAV